LHYLLKGSQPVVLVLARGMKQRLEPELVAEVEKGRLLVVAPFAAHVKRITQATAMERNRFMVANAQHVVVGHARNGGSIAAMLPASYLSRTHL
jgi:hypothetical protein